MTEIFPAEDDALLDRLQRAAFDYFVHAANPHNGLVADTTRDNAPVSIAVVGFALSSYPVAVERGWMARSEAVDRTLTVLRFFRDSVQSADPEATGFRGFYYHFLDIRTGLRVWQSELSMIDTALLIAGVVTAGMYFTAETSDEIELRKIVDCLYRRVDWRWAQADAPTIRHGWKPECGFLHYGWEGYSEAILLYVLAMGSPTHAITGNCFHAWTSTYQWENLYGYDCLYGGSLFMHQFSHAWIDFRGIRDHFMREKASDYFENSQRALDIQRAFARRNPNEFAGYDENCWGLSACEGPVDGQPEVSAPTRRFFGYAARAVPYGPDDGTLSAPSVLASLPFAPSIALDALRAMITRYPEILSDDRLSNGFNASLTAAGGGPWVSRGHYGLDQGIVLMMIENHRTEYYWRLMRGCLPIRNGLKHAGFRGGWLEQTPVQRAS